VACISDKENSNASANQALIESQSAKDEVKAEAVDEFDDDDAIEALVEAEACSSPV
jgi:uracil-DNA glycosylase